MAVGEVTLVLKVGELPPDRRNRNTGRSQSEAWAKATAFMDAHPGQWCELFSSDHARNGNLSARSRHYRSRYEFTTRKIDGRVSLWGRTKSAPVPEGAT